MKDEIIECGFIKRAHGLKGECSVAWNNTDSAARKGSIVYLKMKGSSDYKEAAIEGIRGNDKSSIVLFSIANDRDSADKIRGATIGIKASELPKLGEGEYYSYQLIGLEVVTDLGDQLGTIEKIFTVGESDVYEVRDSAGNELLVPAIAEIVLKVDLKEHRMTIKPLEGML